MDRSLHTTHTNKSERRSGCDRRQFTYAIYLPERRLAKERRYNKRINEISKTSKIFSPIIKESREISTPAFS